MLKVAPYLTRTGALLFVSAESNNKSNDGTDHAHEREQITVCNHTHQLLSEKSGSWSIAPSVPRVSILYCQGGAWWDEALFSQWGELPNAPNLVHLERLSFCLLYAVRRYLTVQRGVRHSA